MLISPSYLKPVHAFNLVPRRQGDKLFEFWTLLIPDRIPVRDRLVTVVPRRLPGPTRSLERNWERCLASRPPALPHQHHHAYLTTIVAVLQVWLSSSSWLDSSSTGCAKPGKTSRELWPNKRSKCSRYQVQPLLQSSASLLQNESFFSGGWSQLHQPKTRPFGTGGPVALRQEIRVPDEQGEAIRQAYFLRITLEPLYNPRFRCIEFLRKFWSFLDFPI